MQNVDFLRRTVRIVEQIAPEPRSVVTPRRHGRSEPCSLRQVVADALAAHLVAFPAAADGSIFSTKTGAVYRHDYYGAQIFAATVKQAGLPAGTTMHDLRHHYASVPLHAGESVVAVAERLGHENASLVLSTYGHLMPDSEERTRRAIDEAWSAPDVAQEGEGRLQAAGTGCD